MAHHELKQYGDWDEESMSKDLGKKEGLFENLIEPYHNSESAHATTFEIELCECSMKRKHKKTLYLRCLDNGVGMNEQQTNDFSSLNKDIYNKRGPYIKSSIQEKCTHSFGGRGVKDCIKAVYEGTVYIFTSCVGSKNLILIAFNTELGWGEKTKNPKIFKINDYSNITDGESEHCSLLQYQCLEYNQTIINNLIESSGFLIFGKIKDKYVPYFQNKTALLEQQFRTYCNNNLKHCTVKINNNELRYISDDNARYTIRTPMKLWKSKRSLKYILTFTYQGRELYLKKGNIVPLDEQVNTLLSSFIREDNFKYKVLETKFYNKLCENNVRDTKRHTHLVSKIYLQRNGTKLFSEKERPKQNTGDYWVRDTLGLFTTTYCWTPDYYIDKLFQINADKLNPNISKTKEFLTADSHSLLINNRICRYFISKGAFKLFECFEKIMNKHADTYTYLTQNYSSLKGELINPHKLKQWLTTEKNRVSSTETKTKKRVNELVDRTLIIAQESAKYADITVNDVDLYLEYPYFKVLYNTKVFIKEIHKHCKHIHKTLDNIEYSQTLNCTTFYFILHNTHKNDKIIFSDDMRFSGEIGVTNNTVNKRHPGANVQFQLQINGEGAKMIKGNKRLCERLVINKLATIPGIKFGTKEHPKSKEQFSFPIQKKAIIYKKIHEVILPYMEEGDIFSEKMY